jgi:hypothetical protein
VNGCGGGGSDDADEGEDVRASLLDMAVRGHEATPVITTKAKHPRADLGTDIAIGVYDSQSTGTYPLLS